MKKNRNLLITIVVGCIIIFLLYTSYYYGSLNGKYILSHFIVCINIIIALINDIYNVTSRAISTENNIKVLIIGGIFVYILNKIDLNDIIINMSKFEFGQLKIERQIQVLKEVSKVEEVKHQKLLSDDIDLSVTNESTREKVQASEKKLEIIQLLMKEPYLLELLIKFVEGRIKGKTIAYHILKEKTSIIAIEKLFECEYRDNSVRLIGLKKDIKEIAAQLYVDEFSNR